MASPGQSSLFTTFTEVVSTTFRKHKKTLADNISAHNALYNQLTKKDRVELIDGGLSIVCGLEYAANGTYQRYSGYDPLNITGSDVITAAEFPWRQVSVNVTASGLEMRQNSGESGFIKLVKARIKNAQKSFANGLSTDFYSTGLAANQVNGLQALIADAGTGTVGGINSSTFSFWQNSFSSATSVCAGGVASATTIESLFLDAWLKTTRGADKVDLIIPSPNYYTFFEVSQTSLKRYAPDDPGQAGMVKMKYKTADVIYDTTASGISTSHAYFINTDYIGLTVHQDANMEIMPELRSVNQDAVVIPVLWQGNLTVSNRALQGVAIV